MPESMLTTGSLVVVTTTARGTMPVAGARVAVTSEDQSTAPQNAVTNSDGRTPPFLLPAPFPVTSQTPLQPHPYAVYTVSVEADGFRPVEAIGVAVFAGVNATLPVELVPAMGTGRPDPEVEDFPPQDLDRR